MVETTEWVTCDDGAKLFVRRWKPNGGVETGPGGGNCESGAKPETPSALIQLVHGMAEHSLRYRRLAEALCSRGIEVWAADMRGHGKTADISVNKPGKGGLLGHTADKNGFFRVVKDIRIITRHITAKTRAEYGERPYFIMGHSWGSFLVQAYIEEPSENSSANCAADLMEELPLRGCILSGTRGPGGFKITSGAFVLALIALLRGSRKPSSIAIALTSGAYNKPFKPNRTAFDWLSRDEKEVDAYVADSLCGGRCSSGFYRDMIGALTTLHWKKAIDRINRNLPVYIFCGSADPVGDMGASPTALVNAYREQGINELEFVVYPDVRHEALNETNREEVTEDLLNWLVRHLR
jgi:alpha-beta hydrolase superfamily lysophospholipase